MIPISEQQKAGGSEAGRANEQVSRHTFVVTLVLTVLVLMIAFAGALCLYRVLLFRGHEKVSLHFMTPDGAVTSAETRTGMVYSLPEPDAIEGYTFIGWRDESGKLLDGTELAVTDEAWYSAVYTVALNTAEHIPYMTAAENGLYEPGREMTRGEAAQAIYTLLAVPVSGGEGFADVTQEDACYTACAALKQLGVLEGNRFHPEDAITRREVLQWVSCFYPQVSGTAEFKDIDLSHPDYSLCASAAARGWIAAGSDVEAAPDADLTRAEFATLMNRVLGRSSAETGNPELTGFLPDAVPGTTEYYAMAEACVAHEYQRTESGEQWTASSAPERLPEGLYFLNGSMYYVGADGAFLTNTVRDGFLFGEDGKYTSGDEALDEILHDVITTVTPEGADREEQRKALYNYVVQNFTYQKGKMFAMGEELPAEELAYSFLTTGKGNCYSFACAFYELARATGWQAEVFSGTCTGDPHGWVELTVDGARYICDTEMEWLSLRYKRYENFYMLNEVEAHIWYYTKG